MNGLENLVVECDKNIDLHTEYLDSLRKSLSLQNRTADLLKISNPKTDLSEFQELEHFTNFRGYIVIAILDLSVNLENLVKAETDWEKIFFIKNSYLIVHESINNLHPKKGKSYIQLRMVSTYFQIGRMIVEEQQDGEARSIYGKVHYRFLTKR